MNIAPCAHYPNRIRHLRARRGLTQAQLANLLSVSAMTVIRWEHGRSRPSALARQRIERIEAEAGFAAPVPARPSEPPNLPTYLARFIGREQELTDLAHLLAGARLVTVTGTGGAGKTRLAIEAARLWEGGEARLIELAPLLDAALIPSAIANALAIAEVAGEPLLETVIHALRSRRVLLILDNCEHLIAGCAATVERLLQSCPALTVLATSREPFNVGGEVARRLQPLGPADSAALFLERASAAEPDFAGKPQEAGLVESLCGQLDGLPLAIELAAPYMRVLSVRELAAQVDRRFELLQARSPTAPARHQTLSALVDWSYDLPTVDEQRLYRRLSVFAGGCTLEALAGICVPEGLPHGALLLLRALIEKSLVLAEERERETRYRMLETLRQHSFEKLREAGEEQLVRHRHLEWFRDLAEQGEQAWRGGDQDFWRRRMERELENCRIALDWSRIDIGQQESGLRLAAALVWPWRVNGHAGEAFEWLSTLLADAVPNPTRAKGLRAAGWLAHRRAGPDAKPFLEEALVLARTLGERSILVATLRDLAFVRLAHGDPVAAAAAAEEGLTLAQMPEVLPWRYTLLRPLGLALATLGRPEEAVSQLKEAVRLADDQQDRYIVGLALRDLASLWLDLGDPAAARACLEKCLTLDLPRRTEAPATLACLIALAMAEGDLLRAVRLAGALSRMTDTATDSVRPFSLERLQQHLAAAGEGLSPEARGAAWAEGLAMGLDQTLDYALRQSSQTTVPPPNRPGGLTPRELEVARAVAGGRTNREIATALVISERTADRHVANILSKLHLTSRAQVAVWAVERGLVLPS
jgi:predicted ATPase/DNA-binding NarL/FixJ family response regulator/DNA-binding XRE family transcriptional regulator